MVVDQVFQCPEICWASSIRRRGRREELAIAWPATKEITTGRLGKGVGSDDSTSGARGNSEGFHKRISTVDGILNFERRALR